MPRMEKDTFYVIKKGQQWSEATIKGPSFIIDAADELHDVAREEPECEHTRHILASNHLDGRDALSVTIKASAQDGVVIRTRWVSPPLPPTHRPLEPG